jgi:hypothetical protein
VEAPTPLSLVHDRIVQGECLCAAMLAADDPYYLEPRASFVPAEARAHARAQREHARRMRDEAIRQRRRVTTGTAA